MYMSALGSLSVAGKVLSSRATSHASSIVPADELTRFVIESRLGMSTVRPGQEQRIDSLLISLPSSECLTMPTRNALEDGRMVLTPGKHRSLLLHLPLLSPLFLDCSPHSSTCCRTCFMLSTFVSSPEQACVQCWVRLEAATRFGAEKCYHRRSDSRARGLCR